MDIQEQRTRLLAKEQELAEEIARWKQEGRDSRVAEVEDPIDTVISSESQAVALEEATRASDTLAEVRDALRRIDEGSYGTCLDCGEPIEESRLNAVPWAQYCLRDQEKRDGASEQARNSQLGTAL
ncbi:MAG: TraR/DksA family transcriptional regulator [Acidobacteriaceae bacterium]|nr:TraR/DksA family transcriptional regulator [Acidobacteriaceae bacterium]